MSTPRAVVTMQETTDIIAGDDQRRDFTKQLCALIKVEVLDDITDVDGNVMGDIVNRGVEKWIYMARGSKNLKLLLKNNLPVTVSFRNYGIDALKSNRVYILRLDVPNKSKQEKTEIKGNDLLLKIVPGNATVYIWGDELDKQAYKAESNGTIKLYLPYGRYHYQAVADGFHNKEGSVFVNDEKKWEEVSLDVITGTICVSCETKNVELYIDGNLVNSAKGPTQWSGNLPPGQHVVEARRKGYASVSQIVKVISLRNTDVTFSPLLTERAAKKTKNEKKKKTFSTVLIGSNVIIHMSDGSTVSCTWYGVEDKMAKIKQGNKNDTFFIPIEEINLIQ